MQNNHFHLERVWIATLIKTDDRLKDLMEQATSDIGDEVNDDRTEDSKRLPYGVVPTRISERWKRTRG